MSYCLYCYQLLKENQHDFHPTCSKKIFGQPIQPILPYTESEMEELASVVIKSSIAVTGVQPKLSLEISKNLLNPGERRFTIVGLWGNYILKPPTKQFEQLPEVEDVTMHLASLAKINIVPHSLIRLQSGHLAYITKRIDRSPERKWHMEDMCQLTERLTEDKYRGSYEQIAKVIANFSIMPGLDVINFYEQVLFSFLTGNADMHLKNFSMIQSAEGFRLSPGYDMLCTALVNPADREDMALNLNGKKRKIKKADFVAAFANAQLNEKQQANIFRKFERIRNAWIGFVQCSFMDNAFKEGYINILEEKFARIF
jgi:serine/threonine-protein kinase HipA